MSEKPGLIQELEALQKKAQEELENDSRMKSHFKHGDQPI